MSERYCRHLIRNYNKLGRAWRGRGNTTEFQQAKITAECSWVPEKK